MSEDAQPQSVDTPENAEAPILPAAVPTFNLGELLAGMMGQIHELAVSYRSLGRDPDAPFIDLIVTRLLKNEAFFEKLAIAVVNVSKAARSHHENKVSEEEAHQSPDKVIGATIKRLNEAPPIEEYGDGEGGTVKMQMNNHIAITSGYKEFEGATHSAIVGFVEDESGEERRVSSLIVCHNRYRQGLDISKGHGAALASSLNSGMKSLIENGKATIDEFTSGRKVWFTIEETIYEGAPNTEETRIDSGLETTGDHHD